MHKLYGTKRSDVLHYTKPVEVFAGAGDDWLGDLGKSFSRPTSDIYHGGPGDDFIFTYGGKDKVFGDSGDDTLVADTKSSFSFDGGGGLDTLELSIPSGSGYMVLRVKGEIIGVSIGTQKISLDDVELVVLNEDTYL